MGWLDSGFGDWFGSGFSLGSDYSGGSGFDWGSVLGNLGDGFGSGGSSGFWDSLGGSLGGSGGSSGGSSLGGILGSLLGGSGGSGSGLGNIFGAILGGLGGMAEAKLSGKDAIAVVKQKGTEDRKSMDFEAALKDYYTQENKRRQRVALDSYGQFSLMNRINPNYQNTPAVYVPTKPTAS